MRLQKLSFSLALLVWGNSGACQERSPGPPTVLIKTTSQGNTVNALRDQTLEVFKDFQERCSDINFVVGTDAFDYVVYLHHIEMGLIVRSNQLAVLNTQHRIIYSTEKFSIKKNVQEACDQIRADWKIHPTITGEQLREAGITKQDAGTIHANQLEAHNSGTEAKSTSAELAELVASGQADRVVLNADQPNAELWIDGKKVTHLPFVFVLTKKDKPRTLSVKLNGFQEWTQTVDPDGQTLTLAIHLIPQTEQAY